MESILIKSQFQTVFLTAAKSPLIQKADFVATFCSKSFKNSHFRADCSKFVVSFWALKKG
jgi:hypothetical protein